VGFQETLAELTYREAADILKWGDESLNYGLVLYLLTGWEVLTAAG